MDTGSDSSRYELDSLTSVDSLHMITDEFRFRHLSTPDVTNAELSKRIVALELDNERLRIDLENVRIEISAKNTANQGLKKKIADLYVEAQTSLQEKQQFYNCMKDAQSRLVIAENATKWYQNQMQEVQANKKTLQIEIDTYRSMLRQKHQTLVNITAKWRQLNEDYSIIIQKHKKEKDDLKLEIELCKLEDHSYKNLPWQQQVTVPMTSYRELASKFDTTTEELKDSQAHRKDLEQRLMGLEVEKVSAESALNKQRILLSSTEDSLQRCQRESSKLADTVQEMRIELEKIRSEKETFEISLLSTNQEREQVDDAIEQLRSQLTKIIAQHRLLKSRNIELEEKLNAVQEVHNENKRLKSLSYSANASLFRRLRQERRRVSNLQKQLYQEQKTQLDPNEKNKADTSIRECLKEALKRNKELKEKLKSTKAFEESLDEGYADGSSITGFLMNNLPTPPPLNPTLLNTINEVLYNSKNFWQPIQIGLNELQLKLERVKGEKCLGSNTCYETLQLTPPPSPPNNTRSIV